MDETKTGKDEVVKMGDTKHFLQTLATSKADSDEKKDIVGDLIISAFLEKKPLFHDDMEKVEAADLLEKCLPDVETFFEELGFILDQYFGHHAQCCRSGLQFLVDEFKDNPNIYEKLIPVLLSPGVLEVEDFMERSKNFPMKSVLYEPDKSEIPASHKWWFYPNIKLKDGNN